MKATALSALAILTSLAAHALAGPLREARINQIVNDVKVVEPRTGARSAALKDVIKDDLGVATGIQSRAELLFQDNTLTRLGAETFFSFTPGTRNVNLERGSMLLQVPKNLGGARIRAASVSASITGTTIMVEHLAGKRVKIVVLEGGLNVAVDNRPGANVMLHAGKMVVIAPDAKEVPKPVDVNLRKFVQTSALVDSKVFQGGSKTSAADLPSMPLIEQEIARQEGAGTASSSSTEGSAGPIGSTPPAGRTSAPTVGSLSGPGSSYASNVVSGSSIDFGAMAVEASNSDAEASDPDRTGSGTTATATTVTATTATTTTATTTTVTATTGSVTSGSGTSGSGSSGASGSGTTTPFVMTAPTILLTGDIAIPSGTTGTMRTTSGDLLGPTFSLTRFDSVESAAKLTVFSLGTRTLTVAGNATINGDLRVTRADVGGWLWVAGTISPRVGEAVTTMNVLKADSIQALGGLNFKGTTGTLTTPPGAGGLATMEVSEAIFNSSFGNGINGANFDGGDALPASLHEGGDGGTLNVGTGLKPVTGRIEVSRPITATTGANASGVATGGRGGTVNMVTTDKITINSTVKVSDDAAGRASKQGGNIRVESRRTNSTAIEVSSSGQLLSLLAAAAPGPGGTVEFVSAGGDILVNGGTVRVDKGTVDIRNNGAGKVELTNANIRGDVVKIGALGANGQLRIGGGSINADTSLKLYGGTSNGEVRFTDNVTLGGNGVKHIAGKTVQIDNGKTVTIGGTSPANVYTDTPNYTGSGGNGSKTGTFGGNGATTQSHSGRPAF